VSADCTCTYYEAASGPGGKATDPDCPRHGDDGWIPLGSTSEGWWQRGELDTATGEITVTGPPQGYPGPVRLDGDNIVKPWRYKGP
jgi:hypothetical protein